MAHETYAIQSRIEAFLNDTPAGELRMLSLPALAAVADCPASEPALAHVLHALSNGEGAKLSRRAFLHDADGGEHDLSDEDLAEAEELGFLVHPETGEEVHGYEERLTRYWCAA